MPPRLYSVHGKVIDRRRNPFEAAGVQAYDRDLLVSPDDFLGEARTDADGSFRIEFDTSKFAGFLSFLEGSPDVYLVLSDASRQEILRTPVCRTRHEIEYHIKVTSEVPNPDAPDPYMKNTRRMLGYLRDVGVTMGVEHRWNLDSLANPNLAPDVQQRLQSSVDSFDDNLANFHHLLALLDGAASRDLEELHLGTIGYDGPQVPSHPRRDAHSDSIEWPRSEAFRWG